MVLFYIIEHGINLAMLQPRMFLLLSIGAVVIVMVYELNVERKMFKGRDFTPQRLPRKDAYGLVSDTELKPYLKPESVLKHPPPVYNLEFFSPYENEFSDYPQHTKHRTSNKSKECVKCEFMKAITEDENTPSSKSASKFTTTPSSISKRTEWYVKKDLLNKPNKTELDLLVHQNAEHGVKISRKHLDKMFHPILGMPVVKNGSVSIILVLTYFRAGSTFLGDILQQNWKTFYHFEPLHLMSLDHRIDDTQAQVALPLLSHLLRCNLRNSTSYVKWASREKNQFLFRHNHFLWATCRLKMKSCFMPEYVSEVCRRAPYQIMKVTRISMHHVEKLLKDNRDLNVKVVHLVRDPRGILSSRWGLEWCNDTKCIDPKELCREMQSDLQIFQKMQQGHREKFVQVRYEDIALNTSAKVEKLYKALGLPFTSVVQKFIKSHTHARANEANNHYSTRRNSSVTAFEWKLKLSFKDIEAIQNECSAVMDALGYKKLKSQENLLDISIPMGRRENMK